MKTDIIKHLLDLPTKHFVGIDNGVTGSVGIITIHGAVQSSAFFSTPVIKCPSYTKKIQYIHRIDYDKLMASLPVGNVICLMERPMINSSAFTATLSAARALEATIIALEMLNIPFDYIDSKEWQSEFISSAVMGHDAMKEASKQIGLKLFPNNAGYINKHGDADGLLIAEYARRQHSK